MAVTRDDVARRAGVSTAVVSYVLNDGPRPVSASARERVLAAIDELGYRRDGVARFLRTGKTHSLALVVPDLSIAYFSLVTQLLCELSVARGYQMLTASTSWDPEQERAQLLGLEERRVDGVILMSADPRQRLDDMRSLGMPIVLIDRPEVAVMGAEAATRHLLDHGRRNIGYIGGPPGLVATARPLEGWRRALRNAGIEPNDDLVARESFMHAELPGYESARAMLRLGTPPDGIIAESDTQAAGVLRACRDMGARVPEDVAVITVGGGAGLAKLTLPSLTSVEWPVEAIAAEALSAVLGADPGEILRLDNREFSLVLRESCGPH